MIKKAEASVKKAEAKVIIAEASGKKAEAIPHRYLRLTLTLDLKAPQRGYLGRGCPESRFFQI